MSYILYPSEILKQSEHEDIEEMLYTEEFCLVFIFTIFTMYLYLQ